MLPVKCILFPTDFSPCAEHAFAQAVRWARVFDAEGHVLNVVSPYGSGNNPMDHLPMEEREDGLRVVQASLPDEVASEGAAAVQAQMTDAAPAAAILRYAEEHDVDLIVMGTHGRRGLSRLLSGSVAEDVVHGAACPVLTVREDARAGAVRQVLAAVDFSDQAAATVAYAKTMAARCRASLALLFVAEEHLVPVFTDTGIPSTAVLKVDAEIAAQAQAALLQLGESVGGPAVQLTPYVRHGHPAHEILAFVDEYAVDLVVMSTHGHTGLPHLLLGSVTEKVMRAAACPVLVVKGRSSSEEQLPARTAQAAL